MTCQRCRTRLTHTRIRRGDLFCTRACEMLAILNGSQDWWLTKSDLAIWVFGDDGPYEIGAVSTLLYLLRQDGYMLIERKFLGRSEERLTTIRGYRLVADATRSVAA